MNSSSIATPLWKPAAVVLAALSLSIGWGIRGNYGHEFGAMLPGALTAMAVCLLSGRKDWQERIAYFAFFGAIGWGFGGSFSYMQVIAYTHSGHFPSQVYGFYMLFVLGFFWAALGGAGTALPAVYDRQRLTELFKPFLYVFAIEAFLYFTLDPFQEYLAQIENAERRHETSIYWLDSDWIQVAAALVAILAFDLVDRRFEKGLQLPIFAAVGGIAGAILQLVLSWIGAAPLISSVLLRYYGDLTVYQPDQLVMNWPEFVVNGHAYIGLGVGILAGIGFYFVCHGRFRCGADLMLWMVLGWFACFILFPVLLNIRMTPPRGENWAGILGMILGAYLYFALHNGKDIILASLVCGTIGGIGFSGIACLKLILVSFGNPNLITDPRIVEAWRHWQSQNWHSFLEQSYGFVNGIAVLVAMALLASRVSHTDNQAPRRRWTEGFAIFFALPILTYVNMVKNVNDWTADRGGITFVPALMKPPLFNLEEISALMWFNSFAWIAMAAVIIIFIRHCKRPIDFFSANWIGRGQSAYLLLLWVFAIGNATKALPGFTAQRLLTEWVILMNAIICTVLILLYTPHATPIPVARPMRDRFTPSFILLALLCAFLIVPAVETTITRSIYGDVHAGHAGQDFRFGEKANYIVKPLLKGVDHR